MVDRGNTINRNGNKTINLVLEKELFHAYLCNEQQLNNESLHQLEQIVEKYPYFDTAKLMLLKNRQDTKDPEFISELKKVAVTCCDRRRLFYYLNGNRYARFFPKVDTPKTTVDNRTEVLLDSFLESLEKDDSFEELEIAETKNEWESNSIISTDYLAYLEQSKQGEKPLYDEEPSQPMKHQELVDRFLEKSSNDEELFSNKNGERKEKVVSTQSVDNLLDDDSFLTETLAQVYIKQKKYEQALTIIKRLSLNFPKKSIYFADQIRFLEYLIYNEKNKK